MGRKFTIFALPYFVFEGKFQIQAPPGAYIRRDDLTEGFLHYDFEGLIFGGAYFCNFTELYFKTSLIINFSEVQLAHYSKEKNIYNSTIL